MNGQDIQELRIALGDASRGHIGTPERKSSEHCEARTFLANFEQMTVDAKQAFILELCRRGVQRHGGSYSVWLTGAANEA